MSVTEDLDCATCKLEISDAMPNVQDLAGRIVILEQAHKMLKTENSDKLMEQDAVIANLFQSVHANDGVIYNLRADVESFKRKLRESVEENQRLQHKSKGFVAQIIDQVRHSIKHTETTTRDTYFRNSHTCFQITHTHAWKIRMKNLRI